MNLDQFRNCMAQMKIDIQQAIDNDLPRKVGNRVVSMTKQNFQDEGYFGKRWKEVKRRQGHGKRHGSDTRRKILTGRTGDLGRSIQMTSEKGSVTIHSDLPYSAAHNEGTNNAGRGHKTKIPQRQFLGEHPKVTAAVQSIIEKEITKILKQ